MEQVHKSHNFSAILRNCDAVGVLETHVVPPEGGLDLHRASSAGTRKWVEVREHRDREAAFGHLRARGFRVVAAHPSPEALDYREVDFTAPTCILVGAELHGVSDEALERADLHVRIPMVGMVRSLNVSVAASLLLFEAFRQRDAAGLYDRPRLPPDELERRVFEWGYPRLAARCRERGEAYPSLDERGQIEDGSPGG
jgi:tRNA (guanosine-2'-O-)-methyltransferase